jgi:hypothetical protein
LIDAGAPARFHEEDAMTGFNELARAFADLAEAFNSHPFGAVIVVALVWAVPSAIRAWNARRPGDAP